MSKHVVIGGGITGLFSALLLSKKYGGENVILVEKDEIGGLLRSFHYADFGYFDIGTHIPSETGDPEVDLLLQPFLTGEEWNTFENEKRDLAGVYFLGKLNEKSIAPDINEIPDYQLKVVIAQFLKLSNEQVDYSNAKNLYEFFANKFGQYFTEKYLEPIFNNFYKSSLEDLSSFAKNFLPVNRLHFFDGESYESIKSNAHLRTIFAYPDQTQIPKEYTSGLKSFYPKKIGIQIFIDKIKKELENSKVTIHEQTNVSPLENGTKHITSLEIKDEIVPVERLYWTAGIFPYANFIKVGIDYTLLDKPRHTVILNLVFEDLLISEKCYYYYNLDPSNDFYRVTLYQNFTDSDEHGKVTLEVITDETDLDHNKLIQDALRSLKEMGLLQDDNKLLFSAVESLPYSFPKPTLKNQMALQMVREDCNGKLNNVILLGINSKESLFFYRDILKDVYLEIMNL